MLPLVVNVVGVDQPIQHEQVLAERSSLKARFDLVTAEESLRSLDGYELHVAIQKQHVLQIEEVNKLHSIITSIQVENSLAHERTLAAEEQLKAMKELLASHASRNVVSEY